MRCRPARVVRVDLEALARIFGFSVAELFLPSEARPKSSG